MKKRATASLSAREWLRGRATTPAPSKRATTGRPKAASSGYVSQKKLRPSQTRSDPHAGLGGVGVKANRCANSAGANSPHVGENLLTCLKGFVG